MNPWDDPDWERRMRIRHRVGLACAVLAPICMVAAYLVMSWYLHTAHQRIERLERQVEECHSEHEVY